MGEIRVLIVDDDSLVRRALSLFLARDDALELVGEAANGAAGVASARELEPDVVLMDLKMPTMDGVDATRRILADNPRTRVLAVTTFGGVDAVLPMLQAGASGYLLKDADPDDIVAAIHDVYQGASSLSPAVASSLISLVRGATPTVSEPLNDDERLTDREREVIVQLASGKSNTEIASAMFVSEGTVKAYLGRIMVKWDVRDRLQLIIRAARAGIVDFSR